MSQNQGIPEDRLFPIRLEKMNTSETLSLEKQYLIASYSPIESLMAEHQARLTINGKKIVFSCPGQRSAFELKTKSYVNLMLFIDGTPSLHNLESVVYEWPGDEMCRWIMPLRRS